VRTLIHPHLTAICGFYAYSSCGPIHHALRQNCGGRRDRPREKWILFWREWRALAVRCRQGDRYGPCCAGEERECGADDLHASGARQILWGAVGFPYLRVSSDNSVQGSAYLGSNSRCRATRSLSIGWKPVKTTKDLLASIQPEVEATIKKKAGSAA
jgi:hypothetical protein